MPIIKSAIKRMKQTSVRRERNVATKKDIKGATKAFLANPTAEGLSAAQSAYDTAVKKGLLKKATASRRKASLAKVAKEAGVKMPKGNSTVSKKATAKPATSKTPAKKPAAKATTVKKAEPAKKSATKAPATKKAPAKKPAAKK